MRIIIIIVFSLLLIGCSIKNINSIKLTEIEKKEIKISKNGEFLFYAYLKNGETLSKISKQGEKVVDKEEIIKVYKDSYYPDFDITHTNKYNTLECGYLFTNKLKYALYENLNPKFCNSFYTENYSLTQDIALHIGITVFTLGAGAIATGTAHRKVFNYDKFRIAILNSKLYKITDTLKEKNIIDKLSIANRISLNPNIKSTIFISNKNKYENNLFLVFDNSNNFKDIIDIEELKERDVFQAVSILTQRLIDAYLKPQKPIKINIPPKVSKPKLPSKPKLIKDEFESKAMFKARVKKAIAQREAKIKKLQKGFREAVEARNREVAELKRLYQKDIEDIKEREELKKREIKKYMPYFTSIAMQHIIGSLNLKNLRYDAENELMYADLYASNKNYFKKIYLKIPRDRAKEFKNKNSYQPLISYKYSNNRLTLSDIEVDNYHAKLSEVDYKPKNIVVELKDRKIDTNLAQNIFEPQNPNLKDKYSVIALAYSENFSTSIANFQDDIPNLLLAVPQKTQDPKKWLFVIGAEKYDNTDSVTYSKRSAEIFTQVAQKSLGVTARNTYALIGDRATSGAIEDKLNRMLENVKEGDSIYFFYSGHGIPVLPNRVPYLLPKDKIPDYIGRSPFFKLTNMYNLLSNSKASKVIAIMDSCFSGSTDGRSVFKGVAGSVLIPKKVTFNHSKMVVLTAGRDKQFSNMYPKRGHRLFSYFIMKALLEGKRDVSDIYNEVYPNVKSVSNGFGDLKRQEPTLEGNKNLRF